MLQLTYISSAKLPITPGDVDQILATSRRNNDASGLSGLLVHDGRRFLQVLEGPHAEVRITVERIRKDPRHRAIVVLSEREVTTRQFGDWAMAWNRVAEAPESESLGDTVDALVGGVPDPNLRALFSSFARLNRNAA